MRAISSFIRDVGIEALACSARFALRMRVSMSAMGSVSTSSSYQLDFVMPGTEPWCASSRRQIRHTPNLRYTARGRPHLEQREYLRTPNFGSRDCLTTSDFLAMC